MKQTNNAIKFLMAQYRAIFKNAYFKGLAAAAVVTMGLAAGAAQAADTEIYGYTNSIKGWKAESLSSEYKELNNSNIANTLNILQSSQLANLTKPDQGGSWTQPEFTAVLSGGLTHYSGSALKHDPDNNFNATSIKHINIIGQHNIDTENDALLSVVDGSGRKLTIGAGGVDLDIVRANYTVGVGQTKTTGGAVFAGIAMNDGTKQMDLTVRNSTLNVTGQRYADHAVVAGYVANNSGTATSIGNTLNYQSTKVKQSNLSAADTYGANLLAGFAQGTHGAIADSNTMNLGTELDNDATVDISQKAFFGGGYAKTLDNDKVTNATGTASASNNIVNMSNFAYDTSKRVTEGGKFTYNVNAHIFGGFADNWGDAAKPSKATNATASNNTLTISNATINTAADYSNTKNLNNLLIRGGLASSDSSGDGTSAINVTASNNTLTINGKLAKNAYSTNLSLLKAGDNIVAGDARQNVAANVNVTASASNNKLTVETIKMEGGALIGGRANVDAAATGAGHKDTAEATNNVITVTGDTIMKNTSINAAYVKGTNIVHSGNIASLDSNVLAIAEGKKITITGDTTDIKGSVWVKSVVGSEVDFGGVLTDNSKYYNGTGTLTGTLYNQGTVNVHNELDITNGTIYALGDNAKIVVDGSKSAETDADGNADIPDPLTAGYATLKTSEQQIKDYLTSGSATNVTLPVENESLDPTVISGSSAGIVEVKSGAAIDFGSTVTLSNFNFANTDTAGAIVVGSGDETTAPSGAYFKADTVNVAHVLASNATTEKDIDKLSGFEAKNVYIRANTLNLGSSTLTSAQSAKIDFAEARARDAINFDAMTTGDNNGYILTSKVVADRKFFDQQIVDKAEINTTTLNSNGNGTITGDVTIGTEGAAGDLSIEGGAWTSNSNIAVVSGDLSVGAKDASDHNPTTQTYTNNGNPASLTLTGTLNISGANATVSVSGSAGADATLDLTGADVKWNAGTVTVSGSPINANNFNTEEAKDYYADNSLDRQVGYGKLLLNREDFNEFLVQTNPQTLLNIGDGGYVNVNGSVTGSYDFDKFGTTPSDGVVAFTGTSSGILDINGDLSLYTGKDATGTVLHSADALEIGEGTIKADTVYLTNYATKSDKDSTYLDTTFKSGTVEVSEGLVVRNSDRLILGDGTDTANVVLNSESYTLGGGLSVNNLDITTGSALEVKTGVWSTEGDIYASGANAFVVGYTPATAAETDFLDAANEQGLQVAQFTGDNFQSTAGGEVIRVNDQAKATFNTMQLADGSTVQLESGHLLVNGLTVSKAQDAAKTDTNPAYVNLDNKTYGTSLTAGIDFGTATINVNGAGAVMEFGNVATNALVDLDGDAIDANKDGSQIAITEGGIDEAQFHVDNFGQLKFNFNEGTALSTADIDALLAGFKMTDTTSNGYLNLGNADLGLAFETREDGNTQISWDNLADYVNVIGSQASSDKLMSSLVYGIPAADQVKGHYGALSVDVSTTGTTHVGVNGPLTLHNAAAFDNYFVVNSNTGRELGVKLGNGASLGLVNGGIIGSIIGNGNYNNTDSSNDVVIYNDAGVNAVTQVVGTNSEGIVNVDTLDVQSATEVTGNIDVETLELSSTLTTLGDKDTVRANDGYITSNAALTTYGFEVGNANNTNTAGDFVVLGSLTAQNITLNEANAELAVLDGSVSTTNFTMDNGGNLVVGYEPDSFTTEDDPLTQEKETLSYSGEFEATGITTLNGGNIFVDPVYGYNTSLVSLDDLKGAAADSDQTLVAGTLDGNVFVGQNAALGVGSADLATLKAKIARFQNNGSLDGNNVGSVLYVGKAFTLGADQGITLTAQSHEDFLQYYNTNNATGAADFTEFGVTSTGTHIDGDYPVLDNTLFLGANTAILVDAGVASNADTSRTNPTAVISFAGSGSVIADGGDIVIDGDVRASTYQVFSNTTISYLDGTAYAVVEDSTAAHYDDNINVATENNFLQGVVDTNGTVTLGVNPNGRAIMHSASDPVYTSLVAYAQGYNGTLDTDTTDGDQTDYLYNGYVTTTNEAGETVRTPDYGNYSNYFLQETISTGDGSAAEAVARLAVYGGAAQAAISAGASTYDAVSGRMGVGANGANITVADNTQGAALWLAPIYKSSDSDGFDAEGVDYGVDMDLYGVALGADYTLSNGIRFGAMFNVGSGEVDGQGAGSAVSNDFDYYGFAVYGGYSMGALSVVADVSYTVADNDLEGNTSIDKVGASLDSTNLSVGVTGQYQLDFNGTTVTPHAGLRFSQIDLDDYTVDGKDVIADYDADSMSIFSIPVGVTFAKEFTSESWTVKPSLDLTLTGNFGDDETDGTVHWAGVENLSTNVSSEVIDNFTYGATLGVAAKTGNFSLGLGVNYTGSSNVDEFGVNANARFVF